MSRDRQLSVILVAFLALLALPAGAAAVTSTADSSTDWPTYGADSANTNADPSGSGPTDGLELGWSHSFGGAGDTSGVVHADGVTYVAKTDGTVAAFRKDGGEIWSRTVSTTAGTVSIESPPAVSDGTVYVTGSDGSTGYLYALDASDGTDSWSSPVEIGASTRAAPTVQDGVIYVGSAASSSLLLGQSGPLTAVWANGTERWTATDLPDDDEVATAPAVVGDSVYAGTVGGTVYEVDASTGAMTWSGGSGVAVHSAPTAVGDSLYVGTDASNVYRINTTSHALEADQSLGDGAILGSIAVTDGTAYVPTESGTLYALDATTLDVTGSATVGDRLVHAPNVVGGTVYVANDSAVQSYATDLTRLDGLATGEPVRSGVIASGGQAFVGAGDGLVCIVGSSSPSSACDLPPPAASLSANRTTVTPGDPVEFDASASTDPDGEVTSYAFDFDGDGTTDAEGADATAVHSYDGTGDYSATVTVTDDGGQTDTATVDVSVQPDSPPAASLSANRSSAGTGDPIEFDASASSDDDGEVTSYAFDFDGDGIDETESTDPTAVHSYGETGNYTATVTVTDDAGNADTASVDVTVSEDDGGDTGGDDSGGDDDDAGGGGAPGGGSGGGGTGGGSSTATPTPTPTATPTPTPESNETATPTPTPEQTPVEGERYEAAVTDGQVTLGDGPVRQIVFQEVVAGNVTVVELDRLPSDVDSPPGELLDAMRIQVPPDAESVDATVRVRVSAAALEESGAGPEDAQLYRWHDGAWQPLPTRTVAQGGDEVVLAADTPGFSVFAVSAQEETATASPSPTERSDDTSPTATGTQQSGAGDSSTDTSGVSVGPLLLGGVDLMGMVLLGVFGAVILTLVAFWRLRLDENVLEPPGE